jgi:hypothetical protein
MKLNVEKHLKELNKCFKLCETLCHYKTSIVFGPSTAFSVVVDSKSFWSIIFSENAIIGSPVDIKVCNSCKNKNVFFKKLKLFNSVRNVFMVKEFFELRETNEVLN